MKKLSPGVQRQLQRIKDQKKVYDLAMEFGRMLGATLFKESALQRYLKRKSP